MFIVRAIVHLISVFSHALAAGYPLMRGQCYEMYNQCELLVTRLQYLSVMHFISNRPKRDMIKMITPSLRILDLKIRIGQPFTSGSLRIGTFILIDIVAFEQPQDSFSLSFPGVLMHKPETNELEIYALVSSTSWDFIERSMAPFVHSFSCYVHSIVLNQKGRKLCVRCISHKLCPVYMNQERHLESNDLDLSFDMTSSASSASSSVRKKVM